MNFKVTLSDTEIVSLVNFIEYWNDVQQAGSTRRSGLT